MNIFWGLLVGLSLGTIGGITGALIHDWWKYKDGE